MWVESRSVRRKRLDALLMGTGATLNDAQSGISIRNVALAIRAKRNHKASSSRCRASKRMVLKFARDAVSRGAVAVVSERDAPFLAAG